MMPTLGRHVKKNVLAGLLWLAALVAQASIDVYEFKTPEQEQRFKQLIDELRCPKCQNQNLADSNADIAKDLKSRVYKLINEGKSDEEITHYLVERYGDFVTYRPPFKPATWLLWFGPLSLFVVFALVLLWRIRRVQKLPTDARVDPARIKALLQQYADRDPPP